MCFLPCTNHKDMPNLTSEVNSLLCCASLLVSVTCTAVVKCIYNLIAISIFTCGIHDITCTTRFQARINKTSVHLFINTHPGTLLYHPGAEVQGAECCRKASEAGPCTYCPGVIYWSGKNIHPIRTISSACSASVLACQ